MWTARSCDIDHEKVIAPNGVILCKISANDDFVSCDEELYIVTQIQQYVHRKYIYMWMNNNV